MIKLKHRYALAIAAALLGLAGCATSGGGNTWFDDAGLAYKYLEYGSYLGEWRRRLALKMWTGWPTFPMVFVKGVLIGGASDLAKLIESGELPRKR